MALRMFGEILLVRGRVLRGPSPVRSAPHRRPARLNRHREDNMVVKAVDAAGGRWLRRVSLGLGGLVGALALAVVGYSAATTPAAISGHSPLTAFDPQTAGHLEQRAWQAYYLHEWPTLFDLMLHTTH